LNWTELLIVSIMMVIRTMIEVILDYEDESDASLGSERALEKTPLSYKLAFNTLYNYGIIKEKE